MPLVDEHAVLLVGRALRHFLAHPDAVPEDDGDRYGRAQEALLEASRRELPPPPSDGAPPRPTGSGVADGPLLSRPGGDPGSARTTRCGWNPGRSPRCGWR